MKIAMAVPTLGFLGGLEQHAHQLALSLRARGHWVALVHGGKEGRDPQAFAAAFDRVAALDAPGSLRGVEAAWIHKAASVAELLPFGDLPLAIAVHDHDLTCVRTSRTVPLGRTPCHRPPGAACLLQGCAVVTRRSPFVLRSRLAELAERGPLVACSRYLADQLVAAGAAPGRVRVLHPLPPEDSRPLAPRPRTQSLLVAGQLVHGKGVDFAIEALAHLPEATLEVAGDGPSRAALERQARRRAPGRVRFHGAVAPERMAQLYDAVSVVAVPSRWPEPFGMVGIEAMRRARPVVAAAHGGIPEWAGAGTALFQPGDPRDLARAAAALLADADAGDRALAHARQVFPPQRPAEAVEALLLALCSSRAPAREAR